MSKDKIDYENVGAAHRKMLGKATPSDEERLQQAAQKLIELALPPLGVRGTRQQLGASGSGTNPSPKHSQKQIERSYELQDKYAPDPKRGRPIGPKPKPTLADQVQEPTRWLKFNGRKFIPSISKAIRSFERVVLDDEAAKLVTRTAHTDPKQMARMTELAVAPYDRLWVEMSYAAVDEAIRETSGGPRRYVDPDERIGFVFQNQEDSVMVNIVQHADGDAKKLHEWPVGFRISHTGEPVRDRPTEVMAVTHGDRVEAVVPGKATQLATTGVVWGYDPGTTPTLKKLIGLGEIVVPSEWSMLTLEMEINPVELAQRCALELTGLARRAVAILALMNTTIVQMGERKRPPGRFMGTGGSKPFLERTTAVLKIPHRIRRIDEYVHKEIRDEVHRIRKRRHHVKGHFRHLPYEPVNGDGWVPCFCPGRAPGQYWHRYVHDHWRGDEELGTVDHDYTIVRGEEDA